MKKSNILEIKNLRALIKKDNQKIAIIKSMDFYLKKGETLCIVGESGCGKTFCALSIMRLLPKNSILEGSIYYNQRDILKIPLGEMRNIRGKEISMVFQDPLTYLNPVFTIYEQISETILSHMNMEKDAVKEVCVDILRQVKIPDPEKKLNAYPHELSGGQRQRVLIAMAIVLSPKIVILDEPTTALDVTIQAEILRLLNNLKKEKNLSAIYITHDLSVVSEVGDRVIVMYSGIVVEQGTKKQILTSPLHPYTKGLIASIPSYKNRGEKLFSIPGYVPSPENRPKGCPFHPRCMEKKSICEKELPPLKEVDTEQMVRCHII